MPETMSISDYLEEGTTYDELEAHGDYIQDLDELIDLDESYKQALLSRICENKEEDEIVIKIIRVLIQPKWQKGTTQESWPIAPKFPEPVTDICTEFCDSHSLNPVVRRSLTKARELFSNIKNLYAELGYFRDDESEDSGHVVIRVEVDSDQGTALNEYDNWTNWMVENISPRDSNHITITVKRI